MHRIHHIYPIHPICIQVEKATTHSDTYIKYFSAALISVPPLMQGSYENNGYNSYYESPKLSFSDSNSTKPRTNPLYTILGYVLAVFILALFAMAQLMMVAKDVAIAEWARTGTDQSSGICYNIREDKLNE